ncbi:MAG: type II secretion system F family protein [bacterium]
MQSFLTAWRRLDDGRHRSEFYRMWRAGASAGFTVPKILETMGPRETPHIEAARQWLLHGTRRGESVASLVAIGATHFEGFERALLALGDESGTLEESLRLLADFFASKHRMMLRVRKRMAYPLFTGICATVIAPFSLLFFGHVAAYVVTVLLGLTAWIVAGGAIVFAAANRFGRKPTLVRARLARALTTAVEAGLPLGRAIRLAADASADPSVQGFINAIDERTLSDRPIAETLANCPHMSPDFLAVLQVAERTGDFSGSIGKLATLYDDGFR